MKYGWMWKIPVRDHYRCGYVFDSSYINDEQVKQEVEELFGFPVTSLGAFTFSAGAFHTHVKNCFAVGLSQNFVESLEATSIWVFTRTWSIS